MKGVERKNWYCDYYRTTNDVSFNALHFVRDFLFQHRLRYMLYLRKAQTTKSRFVKLFCEIKLYRLCRKYGIEIKSHTLIGHGLVLLHPYNITVSPYAILGNNVTLMKGTSIGLSNGGAPILGNRVYVGFNSTILGGVHIGNDVVIAPNQFVNFDVPDHSVVANGIHHKENATAKLIWKVFEE